MVLGRVGGGVRQLQLQRRRDRKQHTASRMASGLRSLALSDLTGLNSVSGRRTWGTTKLSDNSYRLVDSTPGLANMSGSYSSGGASQCLTYGCSPSCSRARAQARARRPTCRLTALSNAMAAMRRLTSARQPARLAGILYSSNGTCASSNYVTPLTADRARLTASIDDVADGRLDRRPDRHRLGLVHALAKLQRRCSTRKRPTQAKDLRHQGTGEGCGADDGWRVQLLHLQRPVLGYALQCATNTYTQAQAICDRHEARRRSSSTLWVWN